MSPNERKPVPSGWLDTLLEWFCAPHLLEQVMGDLHERYYHRAEREGEANARRKYLGEVLAFMRPSVFKRKTFNRSKPLPADMFGNYLKIAFRNLVNKRVYSGINIIGLSIGLACSFFILLWVTDEIAYDRFS